MAELKVHADSYNALSPADQAKIKEIISGIFKEQHTIVADRGAPAVGAMAPGAADAAAKAAFSNPFCTAACNIAEAAAVAACGVLSGPAVPVCIAVAHAAGAFCRSRC